VGKQEAHRKVEIIGVSL